jgi:hypothetical protein
MMRKVSVSAVTMLPSRPAAGPDVIEGDRMGEADVFVLADRALNEVIQQVKDDQWTMTMPVDFAMRGVDHAPTLREVVNYHAYDDAWVPDMLAGRTMDEAGRDKFDGDLLGSDPKISFAAIVDSACWAAAQLYDPDRILHCSFGDFSARESTSGRSTASVACVPMIWRW